MVLYNLSSHKNKNTNNMSYWIQIYFNILILCFIHINGDKFQVFKNVFYFPRLLPPALLDSNLLILYRFGDKFQVCKNGFFTIMATGPDEQCSTFFQTKLLMVKAMSQQMV